MPGDQANLPYNRMLSQRTLGGKQEEKRMLHQSTTLLNQEEVHQAQETLERDQKRMHEYEAELKKLGVELKDYFTGLLDFYSLRDGREVYLCWKLGEQGITHWHTSSEGFAGRKPVDERIAKAKKAN